MARTDTKPADWQHPASYAYWAAEPYWTVEVAAALMLDADLVYLTNCPDERVLRLFGSAKRVIGLGQHNGELPVVIRPAVFIEWLE